MVERELRYLRSVPDLVTDHLYFQFTLDLVESRKVTGRKVLALLAVIYRLFRLRLQGRISCLLYPAGGPHWVPLVRDILLLPWCLLLSERTIVHFHAAGVGDVIENLPSALRNLVHHVYSECTGAIVMSRFGMRDPMRCGMRRIRVVPNLVEDRSRSHVITPPI